MKIKDKIYGTLEIMNELQSPYDRVLGSVICEERNFEFTGLDVIKREDGTHYALDYEKYYGTTQKSRYSELFQYGNKFFRYNYTDCLVTMLSKATDEDVLEEESWKNNHNGNGLFDLILIDGSYYYEWNSVGLSKDNWENEELRKEYLSEYIYEVNYECQQLVDDFIKYELPLYQKGDN